MEYVLESLFAVAQHHPVPVGPPFPHVQEVVIAYSHDVAVQYVTPGGIDELDDGELVEEEDNLVEDELVDVDVVEVVPVEPPEMV
jgi:hypothetical protein